MRKDYAAFGSRFHVSAIPVILDAESILEECGTLDTVGTKFKTIDFNRAWHVAYVKALARHMSRFRKLKIELFSGCIFRTNKRTLRSTGSVNCFRQLFEAAVQPGSRTMEFESEVGPSRSLALVSR